MAKKKQQNTIRTDYLENWIGFYRAHGYGTKAQALCKVARDIGAPIDADEVDLWEATHKSTQLELFTEYNTPALTPV